MSTTAAALTSAAKALLLQYPHLGPDGAYREVLARDPGLAERHFHGDPGTMAPPTMVTTTTPSTSATPELIDPAAILMQYAAVAGVSFREACHAHPALARAYHHGEYVQAPKLPPRPAERVLVFRAALPADRIGADGAIRGVQIFRVGTWNGLAYSTADLDAIVAAAPAMGFRPPVKLGHGDDPAALAHGVVTNLRRQGDVLLADFEGVPAETLALIRAGRLLSVSAEIYMDVKRNGQTFRRALRAVALLGGHPPAVSDLRPLTDLLPAGRA